MVFILDDVNQGLARFELSDVLTQVILYVAQRKAGAGLTSQRRKLPVHISNLLDTKAKIGEERLVSGHGELRLIQPPSGLQGTHKTLFPGKL
jgi:hypothetical protein